MKFCVLFITLCFSLYAHSIFGVAPSPEWPQWRGPNRDGKAVDTGINTDWNSRKPTLQWMGEGLGRGFGSVSIHGDQLFVMGTFNDGQYALCFNLKTQNVAWKTLINASTPKLGGHEGSRCTPTLDADFLYVLSASGDIVCLTQSTGKIVWQKNLEQQWQGKMMSGWGYSESPLVDGDWLLCTPGSSKAMLVALDKKTGKQIWNTEVPADLGSHGKDGAGYSSIVISHAAGVKQYVTLVGRGLVGVRASDGKFLWGYNRITNTTAAIPTCIPSGDYVFCSSGYRDGGTGLVKLEKAGDGVKATEVYYHDAKMFQNHHGGLVLHEGHIYCGHGHNNGFPACLELATGKILWGTDKRGEGSGSAAVLFIDGHLIFRYESGKVALVGATTAGYKVKGSFDPEHKDRQSWAHPVVVNRKLYLREQDRLMCYDLAP